MKQTDAIAQVEALGVSKVELTPGVQYGLKGARPIRFVTIYAELNGRPFIHYAKSYKSAAAELAAELPHIKAFHAILKAEEAV